MNLPTPTKKDIEAAEIYANHEWDEDCDTAGWSWAVNDYIAGRMEERALALKLVEAMFDEVAHEIADFFGRPCTDSVVHEKIIAIKEKRILEYKYATGIGDEECSH